ncbi:MAG: alpha/beta hydrolase, partial [Oscillospiraceae bacterium]|nr:alpha/beta hydrolase [Oscillospiraceae bacterium]
MKKALKIVVKILLALIILIVIFLLVMFIYNKIKMKSEEPLLKPLGQMVEVDNHKMSIYTEGEGEKTLVFLSGSG